jgi:hypothetical protein
MGDMTRRDEITPVSARRARVVGQPVAMPPVVPVDVGAPPPVGAGPQNVIFVVAPQPPVPPPPPQVVHHHHHHTTQVILPARPRRRPARGTSFLGTLGLVVGGLGCAAACLPPVVASAHYIALAGLGMAALAWLAAVLLRRTGATMPFAGMVVSAVAYGLWLFNAGQAQPTYDRLRVRWPVLPAIQFQAPPPAPAAEPAAGTPVPTPPGAAPLAHAPVPRSIPRSASTGTPGSSRDPTIFDPDSPGWTRPTTKP